MCQTPLEALGTQRWGKQGKSLPSRCSGSGGRDGQASIRSTCSQLKGMAPWGKGKQGRSTAAGMSVCAGTGEGGALHAAAGEGLAREGTRSTDLTRWGRRNSHVASWMVGRGTEQTQDVLKGQE